MNLLVVCLMVSVATGYPDPDKSNPRTNRAGLQLQNSKLSTGNMRIFLYYSTFGLHHSQITTMHVSFNNATRSFYNLPDGASWDLKLGTQIMTIYSSKLVSIHFHLFNTLLFYLSGIINHNQTTVNVPWMDHRPSWHDNSNIWSVNLFRKKFIRWKGRLKINPR